MESLAQRYERYRKALAGERLPAAWLDLDMLQQNALSMLQRAGQQPLRLATKSIRCRQALRHVLDMDPRYQGLLCYHAQEAVWLSQEGFSDLVVAYPTVQQADLEAVAMQCAAGHSIALMTDHGDQLMHINRVAAEHNIIQPVWLDLDCSVAYPGLWFGVYRSPLQTPDDLDTYLDQLQRCPHVRLSGLMGYEAQIAGLADALPGKWLMNNMIQRLKQNSVGKVAKRRKLALDKIAERGFQGLKVNAGGTGSLESSSRESWVTELAAGSGLFGPLLFDAYRQFKPQPAAGFCLEVCRIPNEKTRTCLGGGYIASGATSDQKQPRPYLPEGLSLLPNEMAGEVQTPLKGALDQLQIGDPVFFRHAKAGELCEHFEQLHLFSTDAKLGKWATYRGEGKCFLG